MSTHWPAGCAALALALTTVTFPGCSVEQERSTEETRLNVVLVTLDTTRADRLSCYGHTVRTSPNIDALADVGVRFEAALAQASLTPVSHASIMTGLTPPNHGVRVMYAQSGYRLSETIPTLATVLQERGWQTGAFLSAFSVSEFFGLDRGFDRLDNGIRDNVDNVMTERASGEWSFDIAANQRRSDQTTDLALDWLGQARAPFYLWVHLWDPHDRKLLPPDELLKEFQIAQSASANERNRAVYDAEIFYVDQQLGRLFDRLKALGHWENTLVVVVADHGQGLGDHDHWAHRLLYDEQIRVPLIVRVPGGPRRTVVTEPVSTTDIYPTVLGALGIELPGRVNGRDLGGLMLGQAQPSRSIYAEALNGYDLSASTMLRKRPQDDILYSLTDGAWKLIYRPNAPDTSELYHLEEDPGEMRNLFGEGVEQQRRLVDALIELDPFVEGPFGEAADEEVLERLRSLGYL